MCSDSIHALCSRDRPWQPHVRSNGASGTCQAHGFQLGHSHWVIHLGTSCRLRPRRKAESIGCRICHRVDWGRDIVIRGRRNGRLCLNSRQCWLAKEDSIAIRKLGRPTTHWSCDSIVWRRRNCLIPFSFRTLGIAAVEIRTRLEVSLFMAVEQVFPHTEKVAIGTWATVFFRLLVCNLVSSANASKRSVLRFNSCRCKCSARV